MIARVFETSDSNYNSSNKNNSLIQTDLNKFAGNKLCIGLNSFKYLITFSISL